MMGQEVAGLHTVKPDDIAKSRFMDHLVVASRRLTDDGMGSLSISMASMDGKPLVVVSRTIVYDRSAANMDLFLMAKNNDEDELRMDAIIWNPRKFGIDRDVEVVSLRGPASQSPVYRLLKHLDADDFDVRRAEAARRRGLAEQRESNDDQNDQDCHCPT